MSYTVQKDGKSATLSLFGKKLKDIFSEGALAIFHLLYDTDSIRGTERIRFVVQAKDLSKLFHTWITELLERAEIQHLACGEFHVSSIQKIGDSQYLLTGMAYGEPLDLEKHGHTSIKNISKIRIDSAAPDGIYSCEAVITFA